MVVPSRISGGDGLHLHGTNVRGANAVPERSTIVTG
jgi:hypothetical protein